MKTISITVQNLKCGGCAHSITNKLENIAEISNVVVNVSESSVAFGYHQDETVAVVKDILKQLGYPEEGTTNSLGSKAKSYVSCAIGKMNS